MRRRTPTLTEHELEIMQVIWRHPSVSVRNVYEELLKQRPIAYTTVMTMMGILEQKGYLKRKRGPKAHLYWPAQPESRVLGSMVTDFVRRVFKGSAKPLLVHLVENERLTPEELDEITVLMREKRSGT